MDVKTCYVCGEDKPLDEFNRSYRGQYHRANICRDCNKLRMKTYHAKKRQEKQV